MGKASRKIRQIASRQLKSDMQNAFNEMNGYIARKGLLGRIKISLRIIFRKRFL